MKILRTILFLLLVISIFGEIESGLIFRNIFTEHAGCKETPADNSDAPDSPFCFDNQAEDHPFSIPENLTGQKVYSFLCIYNSFTPRTSEFSSSVWQPPKSA
jgi:hypothetical protein